MSDGKDCFNCKNFLLCRLRNKASELVDYVNITGNLWNSQEFNPKLYSLIGEHCSQWSNNEIVLLKELGE